MTYSCSIQTVPNHFLLLNVPKNVFHKDLFNDFPREQSEVGWLVVLWILLLASSEEICIICLSPAIWEILFVRTEANKILSSSAISAPTVTHSM